MKKSKYLSFERNKYFYGKLLSVDDFQLEQRYGNDKRRMINRFLHGVGVVAGLYVVRVDEKTVSVETGIAMDALGREIVVDTPVIKKLSLMDGFQNCVEESEKDYVYLCLDYSETETGVVHNVAGNSILQEEETYNKIKETYQLYLTDMEPEQEILDKSSLYENCSIIYLQDGVCIKQYTPKYVVAGGKAQMRLEIENLSKNYVAFSYKVTLECLTCKEQTSFTVNFNEMQYEKRGKYMLTYELDAVDTKGIMGYITRNKDSLRLFMGKEEITIEFQEDSRGICIVDEDIRQKIAEDYYRTAMDNIVEVNQQEKLYLAKLYLLHIGDSYVIDRIENVPFRQYVLNQKLSFAMHQLTIESGGGESGNIKSENLSGESHEKGETGKGIRMAQGTYWLDLDGGGQKGTRYVSEEIPHGLGLGSVMVQVGLEDENQVITYGSSEIFEDTDPMLELAVKVYPESGTFQIGGRLLEQVIKSGVNIRWNAIMNVEEKIAEKVVRKIFIKPSVLELSTRESHYLEVICSNMADHTIEWKVKEHGGSINENGMYTAPNMPGVYEVVAQSVAYPDVRASIFVVVREA